MGIVVSLIGYVPPPRFDHNPWTEVLVQEAAVPAGPWTQIDAQALTPVDIDPSDPVGRNITTSQATLQDGYYRVIFIDAGGGRSTPSEPVINPDSEAPLPPSADRVRNMSPLLRSLYPLQNPDDYANTDLMTLVSQATAEVQAMTWRLIDPVLGDAAPEGYQSEAVPVALVPVALQAIARMSERIAVTTDPDLAEQIATGRMLSSFNAGPYSESYFAPGEFMRRGVVTRPPMDTDQALDQALWNLATEDARDYFVWRSTGMAPPVGIASSFDYRRQGLGYNAGSAGAPGGFGRGGPDGY